MNKHDHEILVNTIIDTKNAEIKQAEKRGYQKGYRAGRRNGRKSIMKHLGPMGMQELSQVAIRKQADQILK